MRQFRLFCLSLLLVASGIEIASAQGQFKYRIDRSIGDRDTQPARIETPRAGAPSVPDLWFGRPRDDRPAREDTLGRPATDPLRVPEGGGAVLDIPWNRPSASLPRQESASRMMELVPGQIVVQESSIRLDQHGRYIIDVHARVVGPAPPRIVTVAGFTRTGNGFVRPEEDFTGNLYDWKRIDREGHRTFLMSFVLPEHFTMRRYGHYLVKFYDAEGFAESNLPRE